MTVYVVFNNKRASLRASLWDMMNSRFKTKKQAKFYSNHLNKVDLARKPFGVYKLTIKKERVK